MSNEELKIFSQTVSFSFEDLFYTHELLPVKNRTKEILEWITSFSLRTNCEIWDVARSVNELIKLQETKKELT